MNLKKTIITVLILIFSIFMLGNIKCNAVNASFSLNTTSVSLKKGKSSTVTLTLKNCEGTFTVTSSDTSVATVSITDNDSDGDGWMTSTATITINAKKVGTTTITVRTDDVTDTDANEVTGSKTLAVKVTEENSSNSSNSSSSSSGNSSSSSGSATTEKKVSTDATLKNLGITPSKYDFSGFKKATTSYNVTVPYEAEKISIYATTNDPKATVTGTGSKTLKVGANTFKVKVTAEDKKTTKTYSLKITRKKEKTVSTDATLKNLGITPKEYDFSGFRKMTTSYSVTVPYDAEKIKIYADTNDSKATVTGTGSKTLDVGVNTLTVKVTAEDKKTTKTYTLKITREEEKVEDEEKSEQENEIDNTEETNVEGLTNLQVEGLELTPSFSNNVYEYNVTASSDTKSLDIKTEKSSDDISIDIVGNEELKAGENVITLLVYNSKKDETTTYQIIVNLEDEIDLTEVNNSMSIVQRQMLAKKIIIIGTLIIIAMLIIIYLVQRNKILSKNEFLENNTKDDRIDLSKDESMFERINENTEVKKKKKKAKGKRFK